MRPRSNVISHIFSQIITHLAGVVIPQSDETRIAKTGDDIDSPLPSDGNFARIEAMAGPGRSSRDARRDGPSPTPFDDAQTMTDPNADDAVLLQRVAAGDSDALLSLHQRYVNLVYSMALRVLGDPHLAEEVTQDVFLKLWQKSQRYDPQRGSFSTWLLSVTRFAAIDRLRREGRHPTASLQARERITMASQDWTGQAAWEQGWHLRMLLDQLPTEQRELIELVYFGGMTHRDLAEHLNLPLGTVKSRLRLGLQKLRELWLEERVTAEERS